MAKYSFDTDEKFIECKNNMYDICKSIYSDMCLIDNIINFFVVTIKDVDIVTGAIYNHEVHIYCDYMKANIVINKYEYSPGKAINVYVVSKNSTYTSLLYKMCDSYNYHRYAQCNETGFEDWVTVRMLYDLKSTVETHF